MTSSNYHICEFGLIRKKSDFDSCNDTPSELYLSDIHFNSLYQYILENQTPENDIPFTLFKKNTKEQIKVKNHVGIIETKTGLSLEILPKIYRTKKSNNFKDTRSIFLSMLKTLADSPFININKAHLFTEERFPILEVFIKSFIEEAEILFNKGIKSNYELINGNLKFLKGKLLVQKNIKQNTVNRSRFYCEFSELSLDIPQNRILKSTIFKLLKTTRNYSSYSALNKLLTHLETIKFSFAFENDIRKSKDGNRLFKTYEQLIKWSEIFLLNKGMTNFSGEVLNMAVLFPMEKIFENYIAYLFKRHANVSRIKAQDRSYYLIESHIDKPKFSLRPDIYIENNDSYQAIIDTKWKLIDETKSSENYKIQISDMYQLYAYGKKYGQSKTNLHLAIIYPKNEFFTKKLQPFKYEDGLELTVYPFDFENFPSDEIKKILNDFEGREASILPYSLDDEMQSIAAEN